MAKFEHCDGGCGKHQRLTFDGKPGWAGPNNDDNWIDVEIRRRGFTGDKLLSFCPQCYDRLEQAVNEIAITSDTDED